MSRLDDLAERIERLVLRHEELKRTNALLADQVLNLTSERDGLKSRLAAARSRIDALLDRLPGDSVGAGPAHRTESAQAGQPALTAQLAHPGLPLDHSEAA